MAAKMLAIHLFLIYPEKNIALVCNPARENAKALRVANSIEILLSGMDISHKVFSSAWPEAFSDFSEAWIIGGDGTVIWFINQYPGIQIPLSVFPGGTGNDFHWMLYGDLSGKVPLLKRIRYLPVIEKGEHLQLPFVQYKQVPSIAISSKEVLHAHIDGELEISSRFDMEILPKYFSFVC